MNFCLARGSNAPTTGSEVARPCHKQFTYTSSEVIVVISETGGKDSTKSPSISEIFRLLGIRKTTRCATFLFTFKTLLVKISARQPKWFDKEKVTKQLN